MANNKVQLSDGTTLMDLTHDTVTPQTLLSGATAHNAAGEQISGAVVPVSGDVFYVDLEGGFNASTEKFEFTTAMTPDQITKAYTSGESLVCRFVVNQIPITLPLFMAGDQTGMWVFSGAGAIDVNAGVKFEAQTFTVALVNVGGSLAVVAQQTQLAIQKDLRAHALDANVHVTETERIFWNNKANKPTMTTVTLSATGWNSSTKQQTVVVSGILANTTKQCIYPAPVDTSYDSAWNSCGVLCVAQAAGKLTFQCDTVPTASIDVYVTITPVAFS